MDGNPRRDTTLRRRIVELIEAHLSEIVEETMQAFVREIPAVAAASPETMNAMRAATARTTLAFLRTYANPVGPISEELNRARQATFARAGETFARDDIAEVVRIGRHAVYAASRRIIQRDIIVSEKERAELQEHLDAFLDELARSESVVARVSPDLLGEWLERAEVEGPDIR